MPWELVNSTGAPKTWPNFHKTHKTEVTMDSVKKTTPRSSTGPCRPSFPRGFARASLVKTLQDTLKKAGSIRIDGLGTFGVAHRKARNGVNPQTKAKIKIPASKAPKFRAAKALKDAVKGVAKK